jgi:hypothetical protein
MQRDESHITKRVMSMNVEGHPRNVDLRKDGGLCEGWHENKKVSMEMTSDGREWKKKTCCADLT